MSVVKNTVVSYCTVTKKTKSAIIKPKFNATELAGTPWDPNLLAIGGYCGLVCIIAINDLTVKYTYRGHNYSITSIIWMNDLNNHQSALGAAVPDDDGDCFDIYDDDNFRDDFGAEKPKPKVRESPNAFPEAPEVVENTPSNTNFDFVEACQSLKEEMLQSKNAADMRTPQRPVLPAREECHTKQGLNESEVSLPSGFSADSNESIENMFEKIDLNENTNLTLVTLDQHMNIWVWDVRLNCAKGNFKISSRGNQKCQPQMFLLEDKQTIVGNTHTSAFFSLLIQFDERKNKLDFDYQLRDNNSIVLGSVDKKKYLAYYPYHSIRLMEVMNSKEHIKTVREFAVYNSTGKTIAVSELNPMR